MVARKRRRERGDDFTGAMRIELVAGILAVQAYDATAIEEILPFCARRFEALAGLLQVVPPYPGLSK